MLPKMRSFKGFIYLLIFLDILRNVFFLEHFSVAAYNPFEVFKILISTRNIYSELESMGWKSLPSWHLPAQTLEQGVKNVQIYQSKHQNHAILVSLLLTLNTFLNILNKKYRIKYFIYIQNTLDIFLRHTYLETNDCFCHTKRKYFSLPL